LQITAKEAPGSAADDADDKSAPSMAPIYRVAERPTKVPISEDGLRKV